MECIRTALYGCEQDLSDEDLNLFVDALDRAIDARAALETLGLEDASLDELHEIHDRLSREQDHRDAARILENWSRAQNLIREAIR